mgnify:CR=1 FL=1
MRRSDDEFFAEVEKRREKYYEKRHKKIKSVINFCVPFFVLTVFVTVFSAIILPSFRCGSNNYIKNYNDTDVNIKFIYANSESDTENSFTVTDSDRAEQLYQFISGYFDRDSYDKSDFSIPSTSVGDSSNEGNHKTDDEHIELVFIKHSGDIALGGDNITEKRYYIYKNCIISENTLWIINEHEYEEIISEIKSIYTSME